MKRKIALLLAVVMCLGIVAACAADEPVAEVPPPAEPAPAPAPAPAEPPTPDYVPETPPGRLEELGLDDNRRFLEPVEITVAMWDRRNDGGSDPTDNAFTEWITEQMLELHNVVITEFVPIFRWEEVEELTILLAEQAAPTISYTFNFPTVEEFGRQDAIFDLAPLLEGSGEIFPYLWDWLGFQILHWNQDQDTGHIWAIPARGAIQQRNITFIREDWLEELGLPLPTTLEEFEEALIAFRDNAEQLLGADARHMTPLHMAEDVGWLIGNMVESFIPDDITDRDLFISAVGGDARRFFVEGAQDAVRVVNRWFNEGLIHPDFFLFNPGDETGDNLIRAGFVGAIASHSWDQPYRDGEEGWTGMMHASQGEQANFIAVNTFPNDAGYYRKILGAGPDRTLFVPLNPLGNETTQEQAVAALLYLDFLSRPETIQFLQIGFEGINHIVHPDGAIESIPAEPGSRYVMNSGMNYDITMPINGLRLLTEELTNMSRQFGYLGVDPRLIETAMNVQQTDIRTFGNPSTPSIPAEEGMGDTIRERGNAAWARAIVASVADFDSVYESEMASLMSDFAQAAMEQRAQFWDARWGSETMLPTG